MGKLERLRGDTHTGCKKHQKSRWNYLQEIFDSAFLKSRALWLPQVRRRHPDMWEVVVAAAQSEALQWAVVIAAVLAFAVRIYMTSGDPLMSDLYSHELDS
jgi:hypothetical protein